MIMEPQVLLMDELFGARPQHAQEMQPFAEQ
jgi:hypothetical protein